MMPLRWLTKRSRAAVETNINGLKFFATRRPLPANYFYFA